MKKIIKTLLLGALVTALCSTTCFAENTPFTGECEYKNGKITSSFDSKSFAASLSNLEPGDTLDYTVTYKNSSGNLTRWYMKNSVLETLEESKDKAENGGYTYVLKNIGPDKKETVLFDNSEVGGENITNKLQGLKQATNATGEYFFIQNLNAKEYGQTVLHIEFDGESEVNDYMDTYGKLMIAYAVEEEETKTSTTTPNTSTSVKTGDSVQMWKFYVLGGAALLALIALIVSWRKDRKKGGEQA